MCYKVDEGAKHEQSSWHVRHVVMSHGDSSENLQNRILVVSAMIAVTLLLTKFSRFLTDFKHNGSA